MRTERVSTGGARRVHTTRGRTAGRLASLAACAWIAGTPFACGQAFSAGGGDAMAPDGSAEAGGDATTTEGSTDARLGDGPQLLDGISLGDGGVGTVQGKVVDDYLLPMAGIGVHCQGQTATTATDGTFTLAAITRPYSVTVVVPQATAGRKHGYVFEGVSRFDPTLQLAAEQSQVTQTTMLSGTVSTGGPSGAGMVFADFPAATPATLSPTIPIEIGAALYSGSLSWCGHSTASPTLYALQWDTTSNLPSSYTALGSSMQTLTDGVASLWTPGQISTVGSGSMTVTVTPSSGYFAVDIGVYFRPQGAGVAVPIQHGVHTGSTMSTVVTPDVAGATFVACGLQVLDGYDGGTTSPFGAACSAGLGPSASPTLQPPPATLFASPPSTAGVGSVFDYAALSGGVYFVSFSPVGSAATTSDALFIVTAGTQVTIPDLSGVLVGFHGGDALTAEVVGIAPFSGIDEALAPAGFAERMTDRRLDTGPSTSGSLAYSGVAAFTAQ